jgi:hypothetical protein
MWRVGKYTAVISLGIELSVSQHEHPASPTETADVREEIKMIERNLERLHSSHGGSPSHGDRDRAF